MGNNPSNSQNGLNTIRVNHPNFKSTEEMGDKIYFSNESMWTSLTTQQEAYKQWKIKLQKAKDINSQHLLLPKNEQFIKKMMCGSSGMVKIEFDNYPYVLKEQIQNRNQSKKKFEEEELWYLLYVLIASSAQFSKYQNKLGDIRPQNIFLNNLGQVKVSCQYSWPSETTNYQKTLFQHQITYLSPEELAQCKLSRIQPASNPSLSQSFSIGLTILQAITLQPMNTLYNYESKTIQTDQISNILEHIFTIQYKSSQQKKLKYSKSLLSAVIGLCQIDLNKRISIKNCHKWLLPYQNDILNLQKIDIPMYSNLNYHQKQPKEQKVSSFPKTIALKNKSFIKDQSKITAPSSLINPSHNRTSSQIIPKTINSNPPIIYHNNPQTLQRKNPQTVRNNHHQMKVSFIRPQQTTVIRQNMGLNNSHQRSVSFQRRPILAHSPQIIRTTHHMVPILQMVHTPAIIHQVTHSNQIIHRNTIISPSKQVRRDMNFLPFNGQTGSSRFVKFQNNQSMIGEQKPLNEQFCKKNSIINQIPQKLLQQNQENPQNEKNDFHQNEYIIKKIDEQVTKSQALYPSK